MTIAKKLIESVLRGDSAKGSLKNILAESMICREVGFTHFNKGTFSAYHRGSMRNEGIMHLDRLQTQKTSTSSLD